MVNPRIGRATIGARPVAHGGSANLTAVALLRDRKDTDFIQALRRIHATLRERSDAVRDRFGVSRAEQLAGMLYYRWRLGVGRKEYYLYELYRRDLTAPQRAAFLSQGAWNAISRVVNQNRSKLDDSKLALARRLAAAGLPAPVTLAATSAAPTARDRNEPEFVPLESLPSIVPATGCVIKRDRSTWGVGVFVFIGIEHGVFRRHDGETLDLEGLRRLLLEDAAGLYLVQERLENHPALGRMGLPSLATLRILTYGGPEHPRVVRAALKLPIGNTGVDNYHAGGLAAPIDLETGRVGQGVDATSLEWTDSHPESGIRFEGSTVPLWEDAVDVAKRAAASLAEYSCVGWDVAITAAGPILLEGNSVWGADIVQRPHRRGIWDGEFRDWCLARVRDAHLERRVRRWLGQPIRRQPSRSAREHS